MYCALQIPLSRDPFCVVRMRGEGTYHFTKSNIIYEGTWDANGHLKGFGKQRPIREAPESRPILEAVVDSERVNPEPLVYYEGKWAKGQWHGEGRVTKIIVDNDGESRTESYEGTMN
jgi:hypothetical protein